MSATRSRYLLQLWFALGITLATTPSLAHAAPREPVPPFVVYGADRFAHGKGWELIVGRHDGRYHGSSLRSFHPGARATLDFDGTALRLFGTLGVGGGIAVVTIDDRVADVTSFFASRKVPHARVYASPPLHPGPHRLTIEVVRPSRDPRAKLGFVNVDSAEVVP